MTPDNKNDLHVFDPDYLSGLICFPEPSTPPLYLTFDDQRNPCASRDSFACSLLYQTLHWFIGLDNKRITIILNGDTDILLRYQFEKKEIEAFSQRPIAVYMYEPLFLRNGQGMYPYVPNRQTEEKPQSFELVWLQEFIDKYQITNDVNVYTCDYNLKIEDIADHHKFSFKTHTLDLFLLWASCRLIFDNLTCWRVNKWRRENYPFPRLKKKAVCLNFRWEAFRELTSIHLRSRTDFKDILLSFFHYHDREKFIEKLGFNPFNWPAGSSYQSTVEKMQNEVPYILEVQEPTRALHPIESPIPDFDGITNMRKGGNDYYLYTESFLSIVSESRCITSFPSISEKTLKPMLMKRPFILLAGPHALAYLKELGFKTFHHFWDESYDEIEDAELRLQAAFKTIDFILDKPLDELKDLLLQMDEILHHNHVHASFGLPIYYKNKLQSILQPQPVVKKSWLPQWLESLKS
jgi:hypothetical protein